jgi:hypothetical protein
MITFCVETVGSSSSSGFLVYNTAHKNIPKDGCTVAK